jgi:hypothetical protein
LLGHSSPPSFHTKDKGCYKVHLTVLRQTKWQPVQSV